MCRPISPILQDANFKRVQRAANEAAALALGAVVGAPVGKRSTSDQIAVLLSGTP